MQVYIIFVFWYIISLAASTRFSFFEILLTEIPFDTRYTKYLHYDSLFLARIAYKAFERIYILIDKDEQ